MTYQVELNTKQLNELVTYRTKGTEPSPLRRHHFTAAGISPEFGTATFENIFGERFHVELKVFKPSHDGGTVPDFSTCRLDDYGQTIVFGKYEIASDAIVEMKGAKTPLVVREYLHHLYDTLILLGAPIEVASIIERPNSISDMDIENLRRFNGGLIDATKTKLVNTHKIAVEVVRP